MSRSPQPADEQRSENKDGEDREAQLTTMLGDMYGGALRAETIKPEDAAMAESVEQALQSETAIQSGQVQLIVEDGWATLQGEVGSTAEKQQSVDAALTIEGIQGVHNQVRSTDK